MMPAIWLRAYRRPDFVEVAPRPIKSQQFSENYFRQIGIWMLLATSLICDRRLILP